MQRIARRIVTAASAALLLTSCTRGGMPQPDAGLGGAEPARM
jgi:hypothetical protein